MGVPAIAAAAVFDRFKDDTHIASTSAIDIREPRQTPFARLFALPTHVVATIK